MDSGYNVRILNYLDPMWVERKVTAVTFPAPPFPVLGTIYAEDSWRSDVLERGEEIFRNKGHRVRGSTFTGRGPAFIIEYRLGQLFDLNLVRLDSRDIAVVPKSIYCASTSYATILETPKLRYATDAILESVQLIAKSCHPASHTAIPMAPWLTLLLQLERAERKEANGFIFADDVTAGLYFTDVDFSANAAVDQLFQYATVSDCFDHEARLDVRDTVVLYPTLSEHLRYQMLPLLQSNERLAVKATDAIDRVLRIQRRNANAMEAQNG